MANSLARPICLRGFDTIALEGFFVPFQIVTRVSSVSVASLICIWNLTKKSLFGIVLNGSQLSIQ